MVLPEQKEATLGRDRQNICVITATPLTIHFFFRKHLQRMGQWADVTLVMNANHNPEVMPLDVPAEIYHLPIERRISLFNDVRALVKLSRFMRSRQFDAVITLVPKAGLLGMLAAKVAKIPKRVHIFQGEVWASKRGFYRYLLKFCDKLTASMSNNCLAVSFSEKEFLVKNRVVPRSRVNVIGKGSIAGVDTNKFKADPEIRARWRRHFKIPESSLVLAFVGRITRDKGILELHEAFLELQVIFKDVWLVIVGPDEEQLLPNLLGKTPADGAGRIVCTGFFDQPEELFAMFDILALPSRREGFGVVALEAGACEIPVVANDIYGISDAVVNGETGILIDPYVPRALIQALEKLISDYELRRTMGKNGRRRAVTHFIQHKVIGAYAEYFESNLK